MKRELLESLGLEKDAIDKVLDENSADIGKQKKLTERVEAERDAAIGERDALKGQLEDVQGKLKAFEGVDVTELQGKIAALSGELTEAQKKHAAELDRLKRQSETRDFITSLETPFVNDETREHYASKIESELDKPENRGKSRKEILDALTSDKDGKPRGGVFKEPENPNILTLPPSGPVPSGGGNEPPKTPPKVPEFW